MSDISVNVDRPKHTEERDGLTVLYVDDEPGLAETSSKLLEREMDAVDVLTRHGGEEALEALEEFDVDCVVSDYRMPGMDGLELLEEVRRSQLDLPFILYTGRGSEDVAGDAIAAGVTDYLKKQPSGDDHVLLADSIQQAVEKQDAEPERSTVEHALERVEAALGESSWVINEDEQADDMSAVHVEPLLRSLWDSHDTGDRTLEIEGSMRISADETSLAMTFDNVVSNFIDHCEEDATLKLGTLNDGFYFEDDCAGIPEEHRERVRDTGYSVEEDDEGRGLAGVRQTAASHGWRIHVQQSDGGGLRLEFTDVQFV